MATIVTPVVIKEAKALLRSSPSSMVTPTRPSAPGTSIQNAGRKLTWVAGPLGPNDLLGAETIRLQTVHCH